MSHQLRGARAWSRTRWAVAAASFLAITWVVAPALIGAENISQQFTPEQLVHQALESETNGGADRAQLLEQARELDPNYAPAQWHSGNVRYKDKWTSVAQIPDLAKDDARINEYLKIREKYPDTPAGQFDLANWCAKRDLPAAERAHLLRVVELNPEHVAAHMRLGDRRSNGEWLTEEQWRDEQARAAAISKWWPKIKEIRQGLAQPNETQRAAARAKLKAISDPGAIPALEALADDSEELGQLAVSVLGSIDGPQAALALARIATFSEVPSVQADAIEQLKKRPLEHFAPEMLRVLSTPITATTEYVRGKGKTMFRQTFFREGSDAKEVLVRESPVAFRQYVVRNPFKPGSERPSGPGIPVPASVGPSGGTSGMQNAAIQDLNDRVIYVLASITGRPMTSEPADWWAWWQGYSGLYQTEEKPTDFYYERSKTSEAVVTSVIVPFSNKKSCFAAGTKVWTLTGPTPIEQIKIGDQVLSQDPDTGELAYKPVLLTTTRNPSLLLTVDINGEKIRATGGHLFWVTGQGWVKACDLKPGYELHGPTGSTPVASITSGSEETAHNLVVDDFHTYFVCDQKVLAHDNTLREPTKAIVPGLAKR